MEILMTLIITIVLSGAAIWIFSAKLAKGENKEKESTFRFFRGVSIAAYIAAGIIFIIGPLMGYMLSIENIEEIRALDRKIEVYGRRANNYGKLIAQQLLKNYPQYESELLPQLKLGGEKLIAALQGYPELQSSETMQAGVETILQYENFIYTAMKEKAQLKNDILVRKRLWGISPEINTN